MTDERPLLVYDGDCGICTRSVQAMERWIRRRPTVVAFQFEDLGALGLTQAQCEEAVQWVGVDGRVRSGHDAVAQVLIHGRKGWWLLGWLLRVPGIHWLAGVVYRWVARNRHRLPGGTAACSLPAAQRAAAKPPAADDSAR